MTDDGSPRVKVLLKSTLLCIALVVALGGTGHLPFTLVAGRDGGVGWVWRAFTSRAPNQRL